MQTYSIASQKPRHCDCKIVTPCYQLCIKLFSIYSPSMNSYQLRLWLTGYETGYLQEHLKTYLDRIQRHKPQTAFETPHLETCHPILFIDSEETTNIPAYNLFTITVNLIQDFTPSRVYFRASLAAATNPASSSVCLSPLPARSFQWKPPPLRNILRLL